MLSNPIPLAGGRRRPLRDALRLIYKRSSNVSYCLIWITSERDDADHSDSGPAQQSHPDGGRHRRTPGQAFDVT